MIRAQEYFAPLRSRHISLQQWERGLLFESWGSRGGRLDRQISGDLNSSLSAHDSEEQEFRPPVKKGIARSVSFSPTLGRELSSELKVPKSFARGLSFPRSLASHEEITNEEYVFGTSRRILNADHSHIFTAQTSTAFLFPRSVESSLENGHMESSETSDISSSFQDSEDSSSVSDPPADLESRPWPKKFFSGGLSFSRDRKFFSGVLSFSKDKRFFSGNLSLPRRCAGPCGNALDRSQSWGVNDNFSPNLKAATAASSSESRLKNKFLARVLTFSRSLDPRGEFSKSPSKSDKTENQEKKSFTLRRGLSFSSSLDPNGENKYYGRGLSFSRSFSRSLDANSENKYFGRGLSFSRSLDANVTELLSSEDCSNSGSPKSEVPEPVTWSKRFISRSGLFFSKTLSPKRSRESPDTCSEKDSTEARPKKRIGHRFSLSFSRFLEPFGDSSSVNSGGTNGPGPRVESKESPFKRFFTRGFQFSNAKTVDAVEKPFSAAGCDNTGPSGNGAKPQSKRFFSKEWSWSRTKSRGTSSAKTSSQTIGDSTNCPGSTDGIQVCESDNPSSRHSQALKNWWSKRCQNSGMSSKSAHGSDQNSRLVLLEKVPESDDKDSDGLTVYVGERGGSLTKYVLAKKILRHHLFQVLLKCSQDELGSDHDYNSGVPIICDPALFLQVARAVGGNFSSETQLCS